MLLMQNEPGEKRAKWITTLQEFDMEIIPYEVGQRIGSSANHSQYRPKFGKTTICVEH